MKDAIGVFGFLAAIAGIIYGIFAWIGYGIDQADRRQALHHCVGGFPSSDTNLDAYRKRLAECERFYDTKIGNQVMLTFAKLFVTIFLSAFAASMLHMWFNAFIVGGFWASATIFMTVMGLLFPVAIVAAATCAIVSVWRRVKRVPRVGKEAWVLALALLAPSTTGCSYANANVQTLVTSDCGVSWKLIQAGSSVPMQVGPCSYKVTVPDYPMQGETKFRASFKDRVLATIEVSYEYTISDAKTFISEAKYLGKANTDTDDKVNSSSAYETAENVVIDKRIREAAADGLLKEDIVEFSQAEYEDKLLGQANELLKNKGVRLNFISFVPTPEDQTRLAIDMMTAMKIYKSRDMEELGKLVTVARSGAPRFNMTQQPAPAAQSAQD